MCNRKYLCVREEKKYSELTSATSLSASTPLRPTFERAAMVVAVSTNKKVSHYIVGIMKKRN